ncbi:hypothetical protein U1Q18_051113 [Sarracenia purpurea var. burkii]
MLLHACDVNLHSKIPVSVLIASQHREHHENQGIYEASRSQGYPGGEGGTEHYEFVHVCNRLYDFSTSQLAHMALSLQSSQKKLFLEYTAVTKQRLVKRSKYPDLDALFSLTSKNRNRLAF